MTPVPLTRHQIHQARLPGVLAKSARTPGYPLVSAIAASRTSRSRSHRAATRPETGTHLEADTRRSFLCAASYCTYPESPVGKSQSHSGQDLQRRTSPSDWSTPAPLSNPVICDCSTRGTWRCGGCACRLALRVWRGRRKTRCRGREMCGGPSSGGKGSFVCRRSR